MRLGVTAFAAIGALGGALIAGVAFAPASWLATALAQASGERVLLADARGTIWSGSALPVLTGGPGSRDASALPSRLHWTLGLDGAALAFGARQDCCIAGDLKLRVEPGFGRLKLTLPRGPLGTWPAAWLAGLGTPWNTLQLGGTLHAESAGLSLESAQGRWRADGAATLELNGVSSRLSTLDPLGSYRLALAGGDTATVTLATLEGALQLSGTGQWAASGLRFRGEARAAEGAEAALANLLNIIGRRQGAAAVISIG